MGVLLFKGGVGVGMLKWQTSGFPLHAGGTEGLGSPREAGGTLRRGAIDKLCPCDWYYPPEKASRD
jgi:hypothetical protein